MSKDLTTIIEEILPEEDEQGRYFKDSKNVDEVSWGIGYNVALKYMRNKIPQLVEEIVSAVQQTELSVNAYKDNEDFKEGLLSGAGQSKNQIIKSLTGKNI